MKGASELVLAASIALGAVAAPAWGLNPAKCRARVKPQNHVSYQDGVVLVDAKGVTGTLLWGTESGREVFPLYDNAYGTCVGANRRKCQLGVSSTPERVSPPPSCVIYLRDTGDSSTCSAYVKKCVPMRRRACPSDMVTVGSFCIDRYEASVWDSPTGTTQYGLGAADDYPCADNGQDCTNIYARSRFGVQPSANLTWFQAQQACRNVGKRLPTSAEWQQAVAGTPDLATDNGTTDCNTSSVFGTVNTASRSSCNSAAGASDMVGNLYEWVADWVPRTTACLSWGDLSDDEMCLAGAGSSAPGALLRGGAFLYGSTAGPLAVRAAHGPETSGFNSAGFRCAR